MKAKGANKQNVLMILIDGLRSDRLGAYGNNPSPSPFIDQLMQNGLTLDNYFSNGCPTQLAAASIITSSLPLSHGGYQYGVLNRPVTLAEVFKKNGYKTSAFVSGKGLSRFFGYDRGFDEFFSLFSAAHFRSAFRFFYSDAYQELYKNGKCRFEDLELKFLPLIVRYISTFISYCEEKMDEPDGGVILPSTLLHQWDFERMANDARQALNQAKVDPSAFLKQCLLKNNGNEFFSFIPTYNEVMARITRKSLRVGSQVYNINQHGCSFVSSRYLLTNFMHWLDAQGENEDPFFSWVHLMDVHDNSFMTYDMDLSEVDKDEEINSLKFLNDKIVNGGNNLHLSRQSDFSIKYVDDMLCAFWKSFEKSKHYENTTVVISADHGWYEIRWPPRDPISLTAFYDELHKVPAIFVGKSIKHESIAGLASGIDFGPTLLDIAGLAQPNSFCGKSMLGVHSSETNNLVIFENMGRGVCDFHLKPLLICARGNRYKLIGKWEQGRSNVDFIYLYDLLYDPYEQVNIINVQSLNEVEITNLKIHIQCRIYQLLRENRPDIDLNLFNESLPGSTIETKGDLCADQSEVCRFIYIELVRQLSRRISTSSKQALPRDLNAQSGWFLLNIIRQRALSVVKKRMGKAFHVFGNVGQKSGVLM